MNKELDPIESIQKVINTMRDIETSLFECTNKLKEIEDMQGDLLHVVEENLSDEELKKVMKTLRTVRQERRALKDRMIVLSEAKDFVGKNYKFMNEGLELIKKLQFTSDKLSGRKYYVRNCEKLGAVVDISKLSERIQSGQTPSVGEEVFN